MESPSKIGGAASPVCLGKEGTDAKTELKSEQKNISPFCKDCKPVHPGELSTSFRVFIDRLGYTWLCAKPLTCDYAIILGGAIASCRVRTVQLNEAEKELGL
jgi:hypothetical protein